MFCYVYIEMIVGRGVSCGMYIVIKTIKGRQYQYQQRTYREAGRVRTESIYMGPVGGRVRRQKAGRGDEGLIRANLTRRHGLPDDETMLKQYNDKVAREKDARDKAMTDLHAQFGLKMHDQHAVACNTLVDDTSRLPTTIEPEHVATSMQY